MLLLLLLYFYMKWMINMTLIKIGKIVNTHGIKGELRLLSKFPYKDKVFINNMNIYINKKDEEVINTYRRHKNFDMITLKGYNNINEVLKYKGSNVYVLKNDIIFKEGEYLDSDLIGIDVYQKDRLVGKIKRIDKYSTNEVIVIRGNDKDYLVPWVKELVLDIDLKKKIMVIADLKGLIE